MIHYDFSYSSSFRNGQWEQVKENECKAHFPPGRDLKIGTYNVLFGMPSVFLKSFARNQKRFKHIVNTLIPSTDPDILSLMEVTQEFMDILLSNRYIQDNYYVSHVQKIFQRRLFEVVIISKQPFSTVYLQDERQGRYQFSVFPNLQEQWRSFMLISTHLWAGENDFKSRERQLKLIDQSISNQVYLHSNKVPDLFRNAAAIATNHNNIILLGDLNLHMRHEDEFIYNNGFVDAYREVYPNEDGYTWDPVKNNYINTVFIFDNRRMRLDRILLRKNCNLFTVSDVEILAQEKIGIGLAPSDHFMLLSHMKQNSQPKSLQQTYDTQQIVQEQTTGFRTIQRIIQIRKQVGIAIALTLVALAVGIPLLVIYL